MKLILNLIKPIIVLLLAAGILLVADLDKRVGSTSGKNSGKRKFAYVSFVNAPTLERVEEGIYDGFRKNGWTRDEEFTIDAYNAQGDVSTLNTMVGSLKSEGYDLIFTACTPTVQALSLKIKDIPIVFTAVTDAVAAGIGETDEQHQANITGISDLSPFGEMVASIRELMPNAKRLGTLYNPSEINSIFCRDRLKEEAEKLGFELISVPANSQGEVPDAAISLTSRKIDAVCQVVDNLTAAGYPSVVKAANAAKIPYFSFDLPQVGEGALLVQTRDYYETGVNSVDLALQILDGKSPADIPFDHGHKVRTDFDEAVAANFGITIPDDIKALKTAEDALVKPEKEVRIAFVGFSNSAPVDEAERGVKDVIKELGWEDKVKIDVYNAQSDMTLVTNILDNVVAKSYDLIMPACTPTTQAVAHKIKDTPIVFSTVADPVFAGLGKSFTDHQENLTGISVLAKFQETLKVIRQIYPDVSKIGTLFNPAEANSEASKTHFEKAAKEMGIELITVPVGAPGELSDATTALLSKDIDVMCQIVDNLTASSYSGILKEVNKTDIPYFTFMTQPVADGALLAIATDYYENGADAMHLAAKVISGMNTRDIPMEYVGKSILSVNLKTARRLGVSIPQEIIDRADNVIK